MRRLAFICFSSRLASPALTARPRTKPWTNSKRASKARVPKTAPNSHPIAQDQLRIADKLYSDGKSTQARAAVEDIVTYSEKARDTVTQTKKHLKNVEINVRKMADKLRDIKRTLAFEDQPPVEQAIRRLEDIRTTLLKEMFAKDTEKKEKK